ncbi:MAG: SIR2 family protein [bacterium]|nr:SIR2 family protein [bacterium]
MQNTLIDKKQNKLFKEYIANVINFSTPELKRYNLTIPREGAINYIFGEDESKIWLKYGSFFGNLLNLKISYNNENDFQIDRRKGIRFEREKNSGFEYSIITLNYDLIFEKLFEFLETEYSKKGYFNLITSFEEKTEYNPELFYIVKLHGSVRDPNTTIPPTWNKGSSKKILPTWKFAYKLLKEANHIRILGYSLPISDTYVRYLLKSAIIKAEHLKSIDVICLDKHEEVRKRYDSFIEFKNYYKFQNSNIEDYFEGKLKSWGEKMWLFNGLDNEELHVHRDFMNKS